MARQDLDTTGNEDMGRTLAKANENFQDLYNNGGGGGALVGTSAAVSGLTSTVSLQVDTGTKTATATAGAATLSKNAGVVTSEALTTAAGAVYTLTLTNTVIAATDTVLASVQNGTNTQGWVHLERVTPGSGSVAITVRNIHASEALNGTIKISYVVFQV